MFIPSALSRDSPTFIHIRARASAAGSVTLNWPCGGPSVLRGQIVGSRFSEKLPLSISICIETISGLRMQTVVRGGFERLKTVLPSAIGGLKSSPVS